MPHSGGRSLSPSHNLPRSCVHPVRSSRLYERSNDDVLVVPQGEEHTLEPTFPQYPSYSLHPHDPALPTIEGHSDSSILPVSSQTLSVNAPTNPPHPTNRTNTVPQYRLC